MKKNQFLFKTRTAGLWCLLFCIMSMHGYGQHLTEREKKEKRDSLVLNSEYIVSAETSGGAIYKDNNNNIFCAYTLWIWEVIKGPESLKNQKVVVIEKVYELEYNENYINHRVDGSNYFVIPDEKRNYPPHYESGSVGVYFLKTNTDYSVEPLKDSNNIKEIYNDSLLYGDVYCQHTSISKNILYNSSNSRTCEDCRYQGFYGLELKGYSITKEDYIKNYITDLYTISQMEGVGEKKPVASLKSGSEKVITQADRDAFNLWIQGGIDRNKQNVSKLKSDDYVACKFTADHQHIVYENGKYYFTFNLLVNYSSTSLTSLYPDHILLYFKYNTAAFGTSIVANNKMVCSLDESVFTTDKYNLDYDDHIDNNNQALISLAVNTTPVFDQNGEVIDVLRNRTLVNTDTEIPVCSVKIEFSADKLGKAVGIAELWDNLSLNVNFYTTSATTNSWEPIDETTLILNDSYKLGAIEITSVEALNGGIISGGNGCKVSIKGSGFMSADTKLPGEEVPTILLPNADGVSNFAEIALDWTAWHENGVSKWTDTEIIFTMPSIVANGDPAVQAIPHFLPPGSGNLKVRNQAGTIGESPSRVEIEYSVVNGFSNSVQDFSKGWALNYVFNPYWSRYNCKEQLKFTLNNAITSHSNATKIIEKIEGVFKKWNTILGFDFLVLNRDANGSIISVPDNAASPTDNFNLIYTVSGPESTTGLAAVPLDVIGASNNKSYLVKCGTNYSRKEIDFYLNLGAIDDLGLNIAVIEDILIHELGHALGLAHVLERDEIMYINVSSLAIQTITPNTELGAQSIFNSSRNFTWSGCTNVQTLNSTNTSCSAEIPTNFKADATDKTVIEMCWESNSLSTSYTIEWSTNSAMTNPQTISISTGTTNNYTHTGLTQGTTYYYRIKANNSVGSSAFSSIVSTTTKTAAANQAPPVVRVQNISTNAIEVEWDDNISNETNFILERKESTELKSTTEFVTIAVLGANETSFIDQSVVEGVTYEYRIKYVTATEVSKYSTSASATPGEYETHCIIASTSRSALLYKHAGNANLANTNYNNFSQLRALVWSNSGNIVYNRSLIDFDISFLPEDAIIEEAVLELSGVDHLNNIISGNSITYRPNTSWLSLVTQPWNESQVTWNTQPSVSATYRVTLNNSTTTTQVYSVDITNLIRKKHSTPDSVFGIMFQLQNESSAHTKMVFASASNANQSLFPVLKLKYIIAPEKQYTQYVQKDAVVCKNETYGMEYVANSYYGEYEQIMSEAWTNGGLTYKRALLDFNLESIPSSAVVTDARLNLFSCQPQTIANEKHYSSFISSTYKSNASYLRRITTPWDEHSVTWNTQPTTTTTHQVALAAATAYSQNYLDIDIKNIMQDMVSNPDQSHGLRMSLQSEFFHSRMSFASSDFPNPDLHPFVFVKYKVYPLVLKSGSELSTSGSLKSERNIDLPSKRLFTDSLSVSEISILPNPVENTATVILKSNDEEIKVISIYTITGVLVDKIDIIDEKVNSYNIDFTNYSKGNYQIEVKTRSGKVSTEKVIYK